MRYEDRLWALSIPIQHLPQYFSRKNSEVIARAPLWQCLRVSCGESVPYTAAKMKAYKSIDSYLYFSYGGVNNAAISEVKDKKFFIVKAKVSAN